MKIQSAAHWSLFGESLVVLDMRSGRYYSLNDSGKLIWLAIAELRDREQIDAMLASTYGIPIQQATLDVQRFTSALEKLLLVDSN